MLSKLTPTPAATARSIDLVNGSSCPSGALRSGTFTDSPGCKYLNTPGVNSLTRSLS